MFSLIWSRPVQYLPPLLGTGAVHVLILKIYICTYIFDLPLFYFCQSYHTPPPTPGGEERQEHTSLFTFLLFFSSSSSNHKRIVTPSEFLKKEEKLRRTKWEILEERINVMPNFVHSTNAFVFAADVIEMRGISTTIWLFLSK